MAELLRAWFRPVDGPWREIGLVCIGIDGPVSSVRLEILRDGNEDFEYFELLRQRLIAKGASAAEIEAKIRSFITPLASNLKEWSRDPEALLQQRRLLAEAILQLK